MSLRAHVDSVEAIKSFRTALIKFTEGANVALADAESEMIRTLHWLEHEQTSKWTMEHRRRHEQLNRAKDALRHKQLYKDATKQRQSTVEEEKAVSLCKRRIEEAEAKLAAIKKHKVRLQKEILLYKGSVQRFSTSIVHDLPRAIALLDQKIEILDRYVSTVGSSAPAEARNDLGHAVRALTPIAPLPQQWAIPELAKWQIETLKKLTIDPHGVVAHATDQTILIDAKSANAAALIFQRNSPVSPTDSGWTILPADGSSGEYLTIPLKDFLALRGDLSEVIALPNGFTVMIDRAGVTSVTDKNKNELWVSPSQQKEGSK